MRHLIFILSYNAERHIESVLNDIPVQYKNSPNVEILIIDDASRDRTVEVARAYVKQHGVSNAKVLKNKVNQGYGGNQKVGYRYAVENKFDVVVMLHGDNQYTPKALPELLHPFEKDPSVGCVLGVRFGQKYSPLSGGMPLYKYVGNRILTIAQNKMAGVNLSEWHTGYRAYSTQALSNIAFELNTHDFHFDTEIILQLVQSGAKFLEVNIPTRYGDEICHVNGMKYAKDVLKASFKFRLQKHNFFFDIRYHPDALSDKASNGARAFHYGEKLESVSPHSLVCNTPDFIPAGSLVLDVGCASGYVADQLTEKYRCRVVGVDMLPTSDVSRRLLRYEQIDLDNPGDLLKRLFKDYDFDVVLLLDVIEHVAHPERFLLALSRLPYKKQPRYVCSTANVAFFVVRFMLLLGHFNYANKGILDVTHKRLFSLHTFRNLLEQTGFLVQKEHFMPFPFRAFGFSPGKAALFEKINLALINIAPKLFSYQIALEAVPLASAGARLQEALASEHEASQRS